jgi:selenide,water dikinase
MGSNQEHFASGVRVDPGVDADREALLYDPQTSGGLLVAASADAAAAVESALRAALVPVAAIGTVITAELGVQIVVRR